MAVLSSIHCWLESVMSEILEFTCLSCHRVMDAPVTTPCAHNFCISCLSYQSSSSEARVLRSQKNSMKCPSCTTDISNFLFKPQENTELRTLIDSSQRHQNNVVSEGLALAESSTGYRAKRNLCINIIVYQRVLYFQNQNCKIENHDFFYRLWSNNIQDGKS
ncbi:putative transcription factor C2H2 family [Helianthus anomalus]